MYAKTWQNKFEVKKSPLFGRSGRTAANVFIMKDEIVCQSQRKRQLGGFFESF